MKDPPECGASCDCKFMMYGTGYGCNARLIRKCKLYRYALSILMPCDRAPAINRPQGEQPVGLHHQTSPRLLPQDHIADQQDDDRLPISLGAQ